MLDIQMEDNFPRGTYPKTFHTYKKVSYVTATIYRAMRVQLNYQIT